MSISLMSETRNEILTKLNKAKLEHKYTFKQIASALGRDKVWVAAAMLGKATMDDKEVRTLCSYLGIGKEETENMVTILTQPPFRQPPEGLKGVCADPTIYRLYEFVNVYGEPLKSLINEECGDGIMSAIGLQVNFEVKKQIDGEHIIITLDGKFLPYKKW